LYRGYYGFFWFQVSLFFDIALAPSLISEKTNVVHVLRGRNRYCNTQPVKTSNVIATHPLSLHSITSLHHIHICAPKIAPPPIPRSHRATQIPNSRQTGRCLILKEHCQTMQIPPRQISPCPTRRNPSPHCNAPLRFSATLTDVESILSICVRSLESAVQLTGNAYACLAGHMLASGGAFPLLRLLCLMPRE
jgi:hypothetical protein